MKRIIILCFVLAQAALSLKAQDLPDWGFRLGYSPFTEDRLGFGMAFRPENSRWFYHFEIYPLQNRKSAIVTDAKNAGFLLRTNYILNKPASRLQFYTGGELYVYSYSRQIIGSPVVDKDKVAQIMAHIGTNLRVGKRVNLNLTLPVIGLEHVRTVGNNGTSNHTSPYFLGFYGTFLPKFGLDIGLF